MIKTSGYFQGFNSKADGSASLRFTTQELTDDDWAVLPKHQGLFGWIVFTGEGEKLDIPKELPTDTKKTPGQRLRASLFVYWKQLGEPGDWEVFYRDQMERFISRVQKELD